MSYLRKTQFGLACMAMVLFAACNTPSENTAKSMSIEEVNAHLQTISETSEVLKAHQNELEAVLDSVNNVVVKIPDILPAMDIDKDAALAFKKLAEETGGSCKILFSAWNLSSQINSFVSKYATQHTDLLFLIDKTGSMVDDIEMIQKGLDQTIRLIQKKEHVRLAFAFYGDKNVDATDWFSFQNFEQNYDSALQFVSKITCTGGGDFPESVYDGFFETLPHQFFKSNHKRMIILVGDAPSLTGDASAHSLEDVIAESKKSDIAMNFYPILVSPSEDASIKPRPKELILNAYPNPTISTIRFELAEDTDYTLEIFNTAGKLMSKQKVKGAVWEQDVTGFEEGVYIARFYKANRSFDTFKFLVGSVR